MSRAGMVAIAFALFSVSLVHAQTDVLIEIDTGRMQGLFTKSPVFQRAILAKPAKATDTALLFFRGYPGIARIESVADKRRNLLPFMRRNQQLLADEGIALIVMDCPTDQWGAPGPPASCLDDYRSSKEHANDVRKIIARLREEHGYSKIYVMGHSMGSVSSRWLAKNLGNEIAGSIHSASINRAIGRHGFANSILGFKYDTISAPVLHVHHESDACLSTPYSTVKQYAGDNLVTVRGGIAEGDPCGGAHLHSYQGREEVVVRAIVSWIKTAKIEHLVVE